MLAVSAFATGGVGVNPPQSGTAVFTAAGGLVVTNTFAYPFQVAPVATIFGSSTNAFTYTTTLTNIIITSAGGTGATNYTVAWNAYVGGTRAEAGSQVMSTTTTNVTFPNAYAIAPVVTLTGSATTNTPAVTSITTTNFAITIVGSGTIQWTSVGTVYNPPSDYTGQNPRNNTVIY
jgi:hypothetical protein